MLIPRPSSDGRGSFEVLLAHVAGRQLHSEDAVNGRDYSFWPFRSRDVCPDYGKTFTESLILAQDERWRRA